MADILRILCLLYTLSFSFSRNITCPYDVATTDPLVVINQALVELFPDGQIVETEECISQAYKRIKVEKIDIDKKQKASIKENIKLTQLILAPGGSKGSRFYHKSDKVYEFPDSSLPPNGTDESIVAFENVISSELCQIIINKFEESEHFEGNVYSNGEVKVVDSKKNREFELSTNAKKDADWWKIERKLVSVLTKYLFRYQTINPIISSQKNPFGKSNNPFIE